MAKVILSPLSPNSEDRFNNLILKSISKFLMKSKDNLMVSILSHLKIIVQMLVSLLLAVFSTISMLKDIQEPDIMEEHSMLIILKIFAKKEHLNSSNSILKNGVSMSKLFQDLLLILPFTLVYLTHMIESCH